MSEVNEVDHQAMQPMLTEGCADWQGFGQQIALEANELLGGQDSVLIFLMKAVLPKKARPPPASRDSGTVV